MTIFVEINNSSPCCGKSDEIFRKSESRGFNFF